MTQAEPGPIRVAHVITGLMVGGAEMALARLLSALPKETFSSFVVSLMTGGAVAGRLAELDVPVVTLGMRRAAPSPRALFALRRALRTFQPSVVQGWMYHGNLAAYLGARGLSGTQVLWNVRQTLYDLRLERPFTRMVIRVGAGLSGRVRGVVYNSETARRQHADAGFRGPSVVIPNGFDCVAFRPLPEAGAALRTELSLPEGRRIVGLVNRYHPMKGHAVFLEAARRVLDAGVDVTFACAGRDVTAANAKLSVQVARLGLGGHIVLLGERTDTARLFAAFDLTCCPSSWGEGFPNVVGESMACGTPCVVTDVGDAALVVGDAGVVVPRDDPARLAEAIIGVLRRPAEERSALGRAARERIAKVFSLDRAAACYAALYRGVVSGADSRGLGDPDTVLR